MFSSYPRTNTRRPFTSTRFVYVSTCALLLLLLSACGSSQTTGGGTTPTTSAPSVAPPNNLISAGTLTVGSDTTYPPQEYIDTASGSAAGFDIDLIKAVAQKMGLKTNIVTAKFDSIIDSLVARRYDVVISAVSVTPEREQKADFIPYFKAGESLLVPKGNPKNLKAVDDLCGMAVGVQNGTIEQKDLNAANDRCKSAGKKPIEITALQDQTAVIQLLLTNRVVATYQDSPVTDYYIKLNPGRFEVGGSVVDAAPEGIVVRKGDTAMFNAIKAAFDAVKADGTYSSLINKWGLSTGAITTIDRRTSHA